MRNPGVFRGAFIFLFFIGLFALASLGVMYLWNWLLSAGRSLTTGRRLV